MAQRSKFEAKGLGPFTYVARGQSMTIQYFETPPEVLEEQNAMRAWVRKAYETALKASRGRHTHSKYKVGRGS